MEALGSEPPSAGLVSGSEPPGARLALGLCLPRTFQDVGGRLVEIVDEDPD